MKTIYKYELDFNHPHIDIHSGFEILSIKMKNDIFTMWILVDTDNPIERIMFDIYGTGHKLPDDHGEYVGTFHETKYNLVWHVFKRKNS